MFSTHHGFGGFGRANSALLENGVTLNPLINYNSWGPQDSVQLVNITPISQVGSWITDQLLTGGSHCKSTDQLTVLYFDYTNRHFTALILVKQC